MTTLARVENNSVTAYPYGIRELKAEYPNISFPTNPLQISSVRDEYGVVVVQDVEKPSFDFRTQRIVKGMPVQDGDTWSQDWVVQDKTADEVVANDVEQWGFIRQERNTLLSASDYRDLPNYPGIDQESWLTYRQALRDVPSNNDDPFDISWPVRPV
jgi:hypothetical protein